jgi:hypothetical protein
MTIQVVCECGFRKEVPEEWLGMRVKCRCGRSFVISSEGSVAEPPVVEPPSEAGQAPAEEPPVAKPPAQPAAGSSARLSESVAARYRARHNASEFRKRLILIGGVGIALICIGSLAVVLKDRLQTGAWGTPSDKVAAKNKIASQLPKTPRQNISSSTSGTGGDAPAGSEGDTQPFDADMNVPIELEADDGLVLTGQFGDKVTKLELTEEQSAKTLELSEQFQLKAEELKSNAIELPQWYIECGNIGDELLALLTDSQRDRFREMIQAGEIERVRLEAIAASLRPELETPSISWRIDADGVDLPVINELDLSMPAGDAYIYSTRVDGAIGIVAAATKGQTVAIWDLLGDKQLGELQVPAGERGETTLLSAGGRAVVRGGINDAGRYQVRVWSVDAAGKPRTKELPVNSGSNSYQLVDCVANRVVCVSEDGFWVWNLDTDAAHEAEFAEWVPREVPQCAISAGGRYAALAHRHSPTIESKTYHFLEIALYDVDTGDLLGNQVVATDYRPMSIAAIAFSYNGRELALLWDVDPPEPQRMLVQVSAVNGRVIRVASGLPTSETSFARQMQIPQRELIWLPDNSGWIVGLRGVADTESEAVVDIDLPVRPASAGESVLPNIVDVIPAGNHRLLILVPTPDTPHPGDTAIRGQIIELPELGPFM